MRLGNYVKAALGLIALASAPVWGEATSPATTATVPATSTQALAPAQANLTTSVSQFVPKVTGLFYTAAQYYPTSGEMDAWNLARFGYQFSENFHLSYNQIFLNDYRKNDVTSGLNFRIDDGFLRTKWKKVATVGDLGIGIEQHYFVPTSAGSAGRTLITTFRNRFLTKASFGNHFALGLEVSPFIFVHGEAGTVANGKASANEAFRNFTVLTPTFTVGKLTAFFPIFFQASRYRPYSADAVKGDAWVHQVFLWPEVTYTFNDNVEVGIMAVTGNLIASDYSKLTLSEGFKNVTAALELTLSI